MNRLHWEQAAALADAARHHGVWLQIAGVKPHGVALAVMWSSPAPNAERRGFIAATTYGGTVIGEDVIRVCADALVLAGQEETRLGV